MYLGFLWTFLEVKMILNAGACCTLCHPPTYFFFFCYIIQKWKPDVCQENCLQCKDYGYSMDLYLYSLLSIVLYTFVKRQC